jgi:hypothetical protein
MKNQQDEQPKSEAAGQSPQDPAQQVSRGDTAPDRARATQAPWRRRHVCALRKGYGALSFCVPL